LKQGQGFEIWPKKGQKGQPGNPTLAHRTIACQSPH